MKQRRPWFYYLLVWLSLGVFMFAWPFLMARDVNGAAEGYVRRLDVLTAAYSGIVVSYLGLVAYAMYHVATHTPVEGQPFEMISGAYISLLLVLATLLFALPAFLVAKTAAFLRIRRRSALGGFASVALFICYGISLPLLQGKLNDEWKAQPNNAVNADAKLPPI
jgi:hypothetical protein